MEKTGIKQQVIHEIQNLAQKYEVRKDEFYLDPGPGEILEKKVILIWRSKAVTLLDFLLM